MKHRPHLDPSVIADDGQLLDAIDDLFTDDADYTAFRKTVLRRQQQLRKLVDDKAWRAYLCIEEVVNERAEHVVLTVVRRAFEQAVKEGASRQREES